MGFSVAEQAIFLVGAVGLGAAAGLLYDLLRVLRVRLPLPLIGGVLDLLYWVVVTVCLFLYTTAASRGEVRIYLLLGVLTGGACYFVALSRGVLWLGYRLADFVGMIWHIATLPAAVLWKLCKKIGTSAKKAFHYEPKWYKIKPISGEPEQTRRNRQTADREGAVHEDQTSISSDQSGHPGPAGGLGHRSASPAQPAEHRPGRSGPGPAAAGGANPDQR